ncbi:hypothetical protein HYU50_03765 [Candidatus Woesearchaeota archaeon]|nr:hypothetical protein [Candidatus Woesearchaeota archaeon]
MPDVFVEGMDGVTFRLTSDRNFGSYELHPKRLISDNLLEKARYKEKVFFYDLGCGKGYAATDFFEHLRRKTKEEGRDSSLVDRLVYIGIDSQADDSWNENSQTRFYKGNLTEVLSDPKLPAMDVGLANWAMPYVDDKIGVLHRIAETLSEEGIFFGIPFYDHQLKFAEGKMAPERALQHSLPWGIGINLIGSEIILTKRGILTPKEIFLVFTHSTPDFHQFSKNGYIGYPGQRVSHYKIAQ